MMNIQQIENVLFNPLYDGAITSKENLMMTLEYLSQYNYTHFKSIEDFIISQNFDTSLVIINTDKCLMINSEISELIFHKCRGKIKLIFYNIHDKTIEKSEFFEHLKWMRLLLI
ncbi:MAG: hypothetical protein ACK4IK_03630 [Bacteroidia bacterium]